MANFYISGFNFHVKLHYQLVDLTVIVENTSIVTRKENFGTK